MKTDPMSPCGGSALPEAGKVGLVYLKIKSLILENRLRPGERLLPITFATRFSVSQTPVREAMQRLAGERLIKGTSNHGYFVKTPELGELVDVYELGATLIIRTIDKAIDKFGMEGLNVPLLKDETPSDKKPSEERVSQHTMFLENLYEHLACMSQNGEVVRIVRNFVDRTHVIRFIDIGLEDSLRTIHNDMMEFVSFLMEHDKKAAMANIERQFESKAKRMPMLVDLALKAAEGAELP